MNGPRAYDVAIVGAGPAGLAVAIEAATRGLSAVVLERASLPVDKACGEGVLPVGVEALDRLGVLSLIDPHQSSPIEGICYVQEDGERIVAPLPGPGLGVRRTALSSAMQRRARAAGVEVCEKSPLLSHRRRTDGVSLETPSGELRASVLVAADGLGSRVRRAEGLDLAHDEPKRLGLRQHFHVEPWTSHVEVHLSDGLEAYVTPAGRDRVGVAFLWEHGRLGAQASPASLLSRFPSLAARLGRAEPASKPRGAGPLLRLSKRRVLDRLALVGDAAGYIDALTGEGLSIALASAAALGKVLPDAITRGPSARALAPYEAAWGQIFGHYARVARATLALARRPALRRRALGSLARLPGALSALVAYAVGTGR